MKTEFVKFLVKTEEGVEIMLEFQAHPAGGGEYFYLLSETVYRYDSIRKEFYTLSDGDKTIHYTDVRRVI